MRWRVLAAALVATAPAWGASQNYNGHAGQIATSSLVGVIRPDDSTITVDPSTGRATAHSGGSSGITTLTGDCTAGPGVDSQAITCTKINGHSLTLGGALTIANLTTASQLLFVSSPNNVGGVATASSGVLVTSAGGVPSISTTLPSGLAATNLALTTPSLGAATATTINGFTPAAPGALATEHVSYQPGLLTAVNPTKAAFHKFSKTSTVDNIEGSAATFSCVANPTVTVFECGTSATCAAPTTIGTVTVTVAGTVADGTVSSAAIAAGDYVAFAMTAGTCASVDVAATVQVHAN